MEWRPHKELAPVSQDTWNERQRKERVDEFAPPVESKDIKRKNNGKDGKGEKRKNKFDYSYQREVPVETNNYIEDRRGNLFFTTKKSEFKRRNYEAPTTSTGTNIQSQPEFIQNELSSDEDTYHHIGGVAIPPPPNWDYYTPEEKKNHQSKSTKPELERSIEAGLRFLREQSDKTQPTTKNKWTANADY